MEAARDQLMARLAIHHHAVLIHAVSKTVAAAAMAAAAGLDGAKS